MPPTSAELRRARPLLGTFVEIAASGGDAARVETAIEAAFAAVETVHHLMSFHEPDSDVSRLNREAARQPVAVHPWTFEVVRAACALHERSSGVFDISIAPRLQELGLLPATGEARPSHVTRLPGEPAVALHDGDRIAFRDDRVRIDLGGIAKGFAVDRALDMLREHAMADALVNAGGDLACFGRGPRTIQIRHPLDPGHILCEVALENEALASSAVRSVLEFAPALSDAAIIEPATGRAAEAFAGVSVRAPTCMIADALTKIVMIEGQASSELLRLYLAGALMVSAAGAVFASSEWDRTALHAA